MNATMIYPIFAMLILVSIAMIKMFLTRLDAARSGKIRLSYFRTFDGPPPPEPMVRAGRHFVNLFELPVLFYVGCLAAMVLPVGGLWIQVWAWLFVASRYLHTFIHLGSNNVLVRMRAYVVGYVALMAMWIQLVYAVATRIP